ncbi:hypothetical protein AB0442_28445 [Kitasatospora sp. NPDC085895]|uniref:hypothetical protein n=1 Tax=Kitasatospora sp. NPDC085895 TaxID=3155057 RepID=UPI00344F8190
MSSFWDVVVPALSILLAGYSLYHQRRLAEDERLWQRRAELYVDLLARTYGWMNPDTELVDDPLLSQQVGPQTREQWQLKDEITARAYAFASQRVIALWLEACRTQSVLAYVAHYTLGSDPRLDRSRARAGMRGSAGLSGS